MLKTLDTTEYFCMLSAPHNEAGLLLSQASFVDPLTADALYNERSHFYQQARAGGDVTKLHELVTDTVFGCPALIEDASRANGGRGRAVTLITDGALLQLALVVNRENDYERYREAFDETLRTVELSP